MKDLNNMNITQLKAEEKYSMEIMGLIVFNKRYTTSDLQGVLTALVKTIARDKDLLTFEERLNNSRDNAIYSKHRQNN